MNQLAYINALKSALAGLPEDVISETVNAYELRFVEGLSVGRSETDIAKDLDDPKMIAAKLKANNHLSAFQQKKNPRNLWRLFMSLIGLLVFNFLLLVPSFVFIVMLISSFIAAMAIFVGGTAYTASSLSGVNEVVFDTPGEHVETVRFDNGNVTSKQKTTQETHQIKVEINDTGLQVHHASMEGKATATGTKLIEIGTDPADSSVLQALKGVGMMLGGIALFLLSLVVSKYTFIGIKRYAQMNFSMLKNA